MIPFFLSDNRLHCHERTVTYQPPERSEMMAEKYSAGSKDKVIAVVLACFSNDEQLRIMKKIAAESGKHHCKTVFFSTLTDFYFGGICGVSSFLCVNLKKACFFGFSSFWYMEHFLPLQQLR